MQATLELGGMSLAVLTSGAPTRTATGYTLPAGPVALLHPWGDTSFYRHGWNSWSPSGWRRLSEQPLRITGSPERLLTADDAANDTPSAHSGSAVGALEGPDGRVLLLGGLGLGVPRVGADERTLWGRGEHDVAEWFVAYGDEQQVFADYAAALTERLGRRTGQAGRVWSSWYSYFEDITEETVARTVADLRGYPVDVVQLDDGWEPVVGDWTAGRDFPSGMAATARTIRDAGFRAGLWLAPLIALPSSEIAVERPDLLVQDEAGAPLVSGYNWGSHYYALDTTQAEVRDHLREVFERVVDWGFDYLKLDFMYAGAVRGVRHKDADRELVYRDAIQHVRDVVGDGAYLLGCGVPMVPSIGVLDGARVGPDVGPFWENAERPGDPSGVGARNSLVASLNRLWLKDVYEVDPDAVYFRSRRSLLVEDQRQALRDVASALGFRSTSDPVAWLDEVERASLRDYFDREPPVTRTGRYAFRIGDRDVDLTGYVDGTAPVAAGSTVA